MITRDLPAYASENWSAFQKTASEISKDDQNHVPLVDDKTEMFCFDDVIKQRFPNDKCPCSVDAVYQPREDVMLFIEFKRGFKRRLTRENWDETHPGAKCGHINAPCKKYWDTYWELQKEKTAALYATVRFKAVETYLLLEELFFPFCRDVKQKSDDGSHEHRNVKLKFVAVIDIDEDDSGDSRNSGVTSDIVALSNPLDKKGSPVHRLEKSLKRLSFQVKGNHQPYLYDKVEAISFRDFSVYLQEERTQAANETLPPHAP